MIDTTPFGTFEEFYQWYIGEIKKLLPNYDEIMLIEDDNLRCTVVHQSLPLLSNEDFWTTTRIIRAIINLPKSIDLVYETEDDPPGKMPTFASSFDRKKRRFVIILPTISPLCLRYPPIVRAAILHELGHINNGDIGRPTIKGHGTCSNIAQDVRINYNINKEILNQLIRTVYGFGIPMEVPMQGPHPDPVFYEIGLDINDAGRTDWDTIHRYTHSAKGEKSKDEENDDSIIDIFQRRGRKNIKPIEIEPAAKPGNVIYDKEGQYGVITSVNGEEYSARIISKEEAMEILKNS